VPDHSSATGPGDRLGFLGHSTVVLDLEGIRLLTDPFLRRGLGPLRRQVPPAEPKLLGGANAVLISHIHRDHLDLASLRRLRPDGPLVVPKGGGRLAARAWPGEVVEVVAGDSVEVGPVTVRAVPAHHDGRRDPWRRPVPALGYVIAGSGGEGAYFAGDTDLFDEMREFGPLRLALLPVWGWGPKLGPGHLDPKRAVQALELLRPRLAVPIHWGTYFPAGMARRWGRHLSEPPLAFERQAREAAPDVEVRVLEPGSSMELT
jgi:L-ascorbate metabolism protein UlaG (beta-lactamase superfamily)